MAALRAQSKPLGAAAAAAVASKPAVLFRSTNAVFVAASSPAARGRRASGCTFRNCSSSSSSRASSVTAPAAAASEGDDNDDEARFSQDYDALTDAIRVTAERLKDKLSGTPIYLVGMMGSGKSTVGKLVGAALRYQFFDTDQLIEATASAETGSPTSVAEIFTAEGEDSFREAETATLQALLPYTSVVVATGGGAVTRRANWGLMQHGVVCWLDGPASLLASRAAKDGIAKRPMLQAAGGSGGGEAEAEASTSGADSSEEEEQLTARLSALLEKRKERYANADLRVPLVSTAAAETAAGATGEASTSSASPALVTLRLLKALEKRIDGDAAAREEVRKFEITGAEGVPKTMRVVPAKGGDDGVGANSSGRGGTAKGKGGGKGFGRKSKDNGGGGGARAA